MKFRLFTLRWDWQSAWQPVFLVCSIFWAVTAQGEEVTGQGEGDLVTVMQSGYAGGTVDASTRGCSPLGCCAGWIPSEPQHVMELPLEVESLSLSVASAGDTVLAVQGPVGWWCNDDFNDLNPALTGRWAAGEYAIYVGAFEEIQYVGYDLTVISSGAVELRLQNSSSSPTQQQRVK